MLKRYTYVMFKHLFFSIVSLAIADYFGVLKHYLEMDFRMFHFPNEDAVVHALKIRLSHQLNDVPVNNNSYAFILNPIHKCKESTSLLILVKSALKHFEQRSAIRSTWGNEIIYPGIVETVFLLGASEDKKLQNLVKDEYEQFKDIVATNFRDSYYNNTIKTLMGFQWAFENCKRTQQFLFVDDDYFVSIKNLLAYLNNFDQCCSDNLSYRADVNDLANTSYEKTERNALYKTENSNVRQQNCVKLFTGFVIHSSPHRHKFSKWYIDLKDYPFEKWPPYVTAGAYIVSRECLTELYYMSLFTRMFKYDDIYLGILALKANIDLMHCSEFHFDKAKYSEPKDYIHVIASHGYENPEDLIKTWLECRSAGYV